MLKWLQIAIIALVVVPIAMAVYSLAQLMPDFESPTEEAIRAATRGASLVPEPLSIKIYSHFEVHSGNGNTIRVYTRESDAATANVLLVHGAGSGAWAWEFYFEMLPSHLNIYALSWRGHFDSSPVQYANSSDYIDDQVATMRAIRLRNYLPIHVIGHSYGAATVVLQTARMDSNQFTSMTLLAPVVPIELTVSQRVLLPLIAPVFIERENSIDGIYGGMFLSKNRMRYFFDKYAGQDFSDEHYGLIAEDGVSHAWQMELQDAFSKVATRQIPMLMVIARLDNVVVPARQRQIASRLGMTLVHADSGHYLPLDGLAHAVIREVTNFISSTTN